MTGGSAIVFVILAVVGVACLLILWMLYRIHEQLGEIRELLERGAALRAPEGLSAGARVALRPTVVAPQAPPPSPQPQASPPAQAPQASEAAAMVPRGFIAQATEGEPLPPEPEAATESQAWPADRIYAIVVGGIVLLGILITLWMMSK